MKIQVGARLASTVCDTEVIVVRTANADVDLRCGGAPMTSVGAPEAHSGTLADGAAGDGTLLGKRYVDEEQTIEVLCTKAGLGALALGDAPLLVRNPKALPSSD